MILTNEELVNRFGNHAAKIEGPENPKAHEALRHQFMRLAEALDMILPDSRQKSLALTELESASMWAHKSLVNKEKN